MSTVGIVGNGFVGNAIAVGLFGFVDDVKIYDKNPARSMHELSDVVNQSDIVFVSVPTPMENVLGGKIDLSILESALSDVSKALKSDTVIVVKSTIVPGTMESFQEKFPELRLVFSPGSF